MSNAVTALYRPDLRRIEVHALGCVHLHRARAAAWYLGEHTVELRVHYVDADDPAQVLEDALREETDAEEPEDLTIRYGACTRLRPSGRRLTRDVPALLWPLHGSPRRTTIPAGTAVQVDEELEQDGETRCLVSTRRDGLLVAADVRASDLT